MNTAVAQHYSQEDLFEKIVDALKQAGIDNNNVTAKDLAAADEFHVRGLEVTQELARRSGLTRGMKVLDVGCGIGGPCRLLTEECHCFVTGIDITHEYVRTARLLSELTGLQQLTEFIQASAMQLPFADETFDLVWTQHVQMNIEDKQKFYSEIFRVLKREGRFIYYDIFSTGKNTVAYPVPWADDSSISYLTTTVNLHRLLESAGFTIVETTDQSERGVHFLQNLVDRMKTKGIPPISLRLLTGDNVLEKLGNTCRNLMEQSIVLESGICNKN